VLLHMMDTGGHSCLRISVVPCPIDQMLSQFREQYSYKIGAGDLICGFCLGVDYLPDGRQWQPKAIRACITNYGISVEDVKCLVPKRADARIASCVLRSR